MDTSFYTAVSGVISQQKKMDVISNNLANVNTTGFKTKNAVFYELINYNLRDLQETQISLQAGSGITLGRTDTSYAQGGIQNTGISTQYAISGRGFFMLEDPNTSEITYTRNGNFYWSERQDGFYLTTDAGKLVLDGQQRPIVVTNAQIEAARLGEETEAAALPGIYEFPVERGLANVGDSEFAAGPHNGQPALAEDARLMEGYLEQSNVNLADEMAKTVEASRAYSYMLKMVQTADEVEQTINSLR